MAESIVPLSKKIKDSLTRQSMWNIGGLHRKGLAEREEKERVFSSERVYKQVLTVKKNMHLILNSSTGTLVIVAISTCQMKDSTARVCARKRNLLTFLIECLGSSRCR